MVDFPRNVSLPECIHHSAVAMARCMTLCDTNRKSYRFGTKELAMQLIARMVQREWLLIVNSGYCIGIVVTYSGYCIVVTNSGY